MANYSLGINPIPEVANGHTFRGDNFLQILPHTTILQGVSGLKFINCNLTNCDIPADAICEGCQPKHVSFCSNLRPRWVDKGLPACPENCSHVVDTDTITIDGQVVDTVYHYDENEVI